MNANPPTPLLVASRIACGAILFLFTVCALANDNTERPNDRPPVRVIFDTDPGGDVDDAGALAVLHGLADRGEIEILAVGVVIGHPAAVPFVDAVNTWYGRPDLPVGSIKDGAPYSKDLFMAPVVADYPHDLTQESAPDVVKLYRKILAAQPDKSVTLVVVGPATNIANLLKSGPDEHSPLDGVELVRRKVAFYAAGGNGNAGLPDGSCGFNYRTDIPAAQVELSMLPAEFPTVFAGGSGCKLWLGADFAKQKEDHIIRRAYEGYFDGESQERCTWDQLRLLYACRPKSRELWQNSPAGEITINDEGRLQFNPERPERNHHYAYVIDFDAVRKQLDALMFRDPRTEK